MPKTLLVESPTPTQSLLPESLVGPTLMPAPGCTVLCLCEDLRAGKLEVVPLLKQAGYDIHLAKADVRKLPRLLEGQHRLILLDSGLPDDVACEVCAQIRALTHLPIMLILRDPLHTDVLRYLEAGADSYVMAPFHAREFLARMGALLRRSRMSS